MTETTNNIYDITLIFKHLYIENIIPTQSNFDINSKSIRACPVVGSVTVHEEREG